MDLGVNVFKEEDINLIFQGFKMNTKMSYLGVRCNHIYKAKEKLKDIRTYCKGKLNKFMNATY
jgi:hypothetical protein